MNDFLPTFSENPALFILLAVVAVGLVITIIKTMFRVGIILAVIMICGMVVFNITSPQEFFDKGAEEFSQIIQENIDNAEYDFNDDGSFNITSDSFSITREKDAEVAIIEFQGNEHEVSLETVKKWIPEEELKNKLDESMGTIDEEISTSQ